MKDNPADGVITAIRALGETSWFLYDELLKQGFSKDQALRLVQTYIQTTITNK